MGTRADFYIRTTDGLAWQGSVAWDGYDVNKIKQEHAKTDPRNQSCWDVRVATTEQEFRAALQSYFSNRDDVTLPAMGWPWPWDDSRTTDCAYIFDGDKVERYAWGKQIIDGDDEAEGPEPVGGWPDMTTQRNIALGNRSGVIVVGR